MRRALLLTLVLYFALVATSSYLIGRRDLPENFLPSSQGYPLR